METSDVAIRVRNLQKQFTTRMTTPGFAGAVRGLLRPRFQQVHAVEDVSFLVRPGEKIAFLGPNGAGKSTTIKLLTGILFPTAGEVNVLGLIPWRHRNLLGYRIGTVFGQRSQLWYHLPARATFDLLAKVYDLDEAVYRARRDSLLDRFGVANLAHKPVRQLSLGERMRLEIVASLLHRPQVLFLDEPTIGLDVIAKALIRDYVLAQAREDGATIFLTSHDAGDIEKVCDRVLVINEGRLLLDRPLRDLRAEFIRRKLVTLVTEDAEPALEAPGAVIKARAPHRTVLEVNTRETAIETVLQAALRTARVKDISVEDPPMEEIIKEIYSLRAGRESEHNASL